MKVATDFSRISRAGILFLIISLACCSLFGADPFEDFIRKTDALTPEQERASLHLPPGFEIQLVASEPDIGKPMNMAFDAAGRLWITQSREYPFAAPLDKPARDKILVLSDFAENGRARKVSVFAEGLNIPIGLYPYKNGVIAFSIPNIYYFQDTDGDGKSDKQDLVLGRFGFEKDVHGLTSAFRRGYDGWLYADHGYNNDTTLTARDGSTIKMNSGNCYRFAIDGSHVEQYSWGQVNPFGLMFDSLGDLWSADCHSSPIYQLLRGAYYPSFGKPNDGLGFAPSICDHLHGSTAIAGMVHYDAVEFPPEYQGNTFVGNVMTCRIDRDSLVEHGSTRVAREQPDFLKSDDPWFRPVDLQLGPDGAIYVADFYNRIIGHYEVPLDHPGRDRERGRIWRIVYRGDGKVKAAPKFDISQFNAAQLAAELADPNITRRMLAMNQLVDRLGEAAVGPVTEMLRQKNATAFQKIHGLWVLQRLNALNEQQLSIAARDFDFSVRAHSMRVLSEIPTWTGTQESLVLAGLRDSNAYVRRDAADGLGRHPAVSQIRPLLDARQTAPAEDLQLVHVLRMALRNQLIPEGNLARLQRSALIESDSRALADVAVAVNTAEAGEFLVKHSVKFSEPREKLSAYLKHAARYAPESALADLAKFTQTAFAKDLDLQLMLFTSIRDGTAQRGGKLDSTVVEWGMKLAAQLLDSVHAAALDWHNIPVKSGDLANPWVLEKRASADGDRDSLFVSSLPGGEKLTGLLRSKPFAIPPQLTFFLAGHDGPPSQALLDKNLICLRDALTRQVLVQTPPPRKDIAQKISWDLRAHAGKQGMLEFIDGNDGSAYAWLAIGRFQPEIVPLPAVSPNQVEKRQIAGAELAGALKVTRLEPALTELLANPDEGAEARAAAAKGLLELKASNRLPEFANILRDPDQPMSLRTTIAQLLGNLNLPAANQMLEEALPIAPHTLQTAIALALAGTTPGAETLLAAVADGKASARLLQDRKIRDRLVAARANDLDARLQKLTANLSSASEERQKLIDARRAAFSPGAASASLGAQVFKQHCALCHSIDGQGAVIGPQLDGVGARGADRLIEDILDPSRNVDRAFRTSLLVLNDGDVQTGLFRREEGEMLVLAESTGKEVSVPKKNIRERRESETSLMPDNFSDIIPAGDFNNLLAYLLSKGSKPAH